MGEAATYMNWNGFFVKKKEMDGESAGAAFEPSENDAPDHIAETAGREAEAESPSEDVSMQEAEIPASVSPDDSANNPEALEAPAAAQPEAPAEECAQKDEEDGDGTKTGALCEFDLHVRLNENGDVGRAALYLAMSEDIADEKHVKEALASCGWKAVATEIGGISGNIPLKASRAIVGAALNSGVVRKTPSEMHALMHAAQEAFGHFIPDGLIECSVGAKIAIVRNSQWLAVAVSGDTAYHAVAHHERVGVGVMHI